MVEILAYHGWGHDSGTLSKIETLLGSRVSIKAWDRGYFYNNKVEVAFSAESDKKIIMTHSFGLHQVPKHLFKLADGIIIISGFINFRKDKMLERMYDSLGANTALMLGQYHANISYPSQSKWSMPRIFSIDLLKTDLERLKSSKFNPSLISASVPKMFLAGESDKIVDIKTMEELATSLGIQIEWLKKSGHGIPYTKPEIIAQKIILFLNKLK